MYQLAFAYSLSLVASACASRYVSSFFSPGRSDRYADLQEIERNSRPPTPRQVWVESLNEEKERYLDIVDLHPDVFATFPRLDIVHKNLYWQAHYRIVDWRCITTRAELVHRSRRKPWPQKGTGRARHGNRRTHIFIGGGQCNGPRGPESYFSILPYHVRLNGLLSMLSTKQAQGDLYVVEDFVLSSELESAAAKVYELANKRAVNRLRLFHEGSDDDALVQRLQLTKGLEEQPADSCDVLTSLVAREKEEEEELLDLIKGGRAAEAANLGLRAAEYLRQVVDERGWGPAVLFITDAENYLNGSENPTTGLAMALACASYAHYIDFDVAPESAAIQGRLREGSQYAAPRSLHPGRGLTLMPVHGLNVWSMVHHDSLVLTRKALDILEARLLAAQRRVIRPGSTVEWRPPLAGDWLVGRDHAADRAHCPERHFSGLVGDPEELRQRLQ
ncbi:39S ribosomal protein L4 mitochondrial [Taenia crassiceps]|uniref:Large ribosomal subunit protein uL4m n=1 Tax=Taenia crassiceps TaxID=6207 RepID=A0ABR4Q4L0_9CEST